MTDDEMIEKCRVELCLKHDEINPIGMYSWPSLVIGYFLGLGVDSTHAFILAQTVRYKYGYWGKVPNYKPAYTPKRK